MAKKSTRNISIPNSYSLLYFSCSVLKSSIGKPTQVLHSHKSRKIERQKNKNMILCKQHLYICFVHSGIKAVCVYFKRYPDPQHTAHITMAINNKSINIRLHKFQFIIYTKIYLKIEVKKRLSTKKDFF